MALSKTSALFYLDTQYGIQPVVGGDPVFTRASAAPFQDRSLTGRNLVRDTPRLEYSLLDSFRRPVLTLQPATTNLLSYSEDFGGQWSGSATFTAGQRDPFNGTNAQLLTAGTAGTGKIATIPFTADGEHGLSLWLRVGNGSTTTIAVFDSTVSVYRTVYDVAWSAGVPTVTASGGTAGTIYPVEPWAGGWYRIRVTVKGILHANTNQYFIYPGGISGTGTVYAFGAQAEDGPVTAYVRTTGTTASRAIDQLYYAGGVASQPQAMAIYVRWIAAMTGGGGSLINPRILEFGISGSVDPRLILYVTGTATHFYLSNNATNAVDTSVAISPAAGDVMEAAITVLSDSSARFCVRANGGTPLAFGFSAITGGLPAAWSAPNLWINSTGPSNNPNVARYAELKIVKQGDLASVLTDDAGRLNELAGYRLSPTGDMLS